MSYSFYRKVILGLVATCIGLILSAYEMKAQLNGSYSYFDGWERIHYTFRGNGVFLYYYQGEVRGSGQKGEGTYSMKNDSIIFQFGGLAAVTYSFEFNAPMVQTNKPITAISITFYHTELLKLLEKPNLNLQFYDAKKKLIRSTPILYNLESTITLTTEFKSSLPAFIKISGAKNAGLIPIHLKRGEWRNGSTYLQDVEVNTRRIYNYKQIGLFKQVSDTQISIDGRLLKLVPDGHK